MKRVVALILIGCGSPTAQPPAPQPVDPPAVKPKPGIDLAGPIPLPDRRGPVRAGATAPALVDLASDRAVVKVDVPKVPVGASAPLQITDELRGWVTHIPESVQLPAVAYGDGRIYVSGGFESTSFYALDASSGRIEWATTALEDNGPTAAIFEDDRVVFNTESCTLFALDAKTGRRIWHRFLGDPTLAQIAVADGMVFSAHPAESGQALSAFRVKDGAPVWSRYVGSELLAAPVIHGDSVYASTTGGITYRFERASGKRVWQKPLRATTAPWIAGDELFVTRRAKGGKEQQVVVAAATGEIVREHDVATGSYLRDVPQGIDDWKQVWAFEGSRPVVDRGVRYAAMGGELRATDATTGELLWHRRYAKAAADQRALGSVALAGSQLVVATRDGTLFGLDVDTGYTLWSFDIGHKVIAEPVIAKGWVYATTQDGLVVALAIGDPSVDGWHMFGGNPRHDGPVVPPPGKT
jgi:Ca-activated chloride channel homolog